MGPIGAYATTVFPIVCGMRPLFLPRGSGPKRLLAPLLTTTECGLWYPLPPNLVTSIGNPYIFLSEIPTACNVLSGIRFMEAPVSTKALLMGI